MLVREMGGGAHSFLLLTQNLREATQFGFRFLTSFGLRKRIQINKFGGDFGITYACGDYDPHISMNTKQHILPNGYENESESGRISKELISQ